MSEDLAEIRQSALDSLARGQAVLVVRPGALSALPEGHQCRLASVEVITSGYLPAKAEWAIIPKDLQKLGSVWWVEYRAAVEQS